VGSGGVAPGARAQVDEWDEQHCDCEDQGCWSTRAHGATPAGRMVPPSELALAGLAAFAIV
jgi:hypothetical protein